MTSWSLRPPYAGAVYVTRDTYILMISWKWGNERKVHTAALPDFPRYRRDRHDDKDLCRLVHRLLDEADIVCAHNGDAFDIKKINSRLITNGLNPPSPFKTIDTLKAARRAFKFDSNKLDNIGRYLTVEPSSSTATSWTTSGGISTRAARFPTRERSCGAALSRTVTRSRGASCGDTASRIPSCWRGSTSGLSHGWLRIRT